MAGKFPAVRWTMAFQPAQKLMVAKNPPPLGVGSVKYIFFDTENNKIIGFSSICCNGISIYKGDEDKSLYETTIPSVEIDFFAIDEEYRSIPLDEQSNRYETLSKALFLFVLNHIKEITKNVIGATHICLYSVPSAVNFYKRCGFIDFTEYMKKDEKPFIKDCVPMFYII